MHLPIAERGVAVTEQQAKTLKARIEKWCPAQEVCLDRDTAGDVYVQLRTFAGDIRCEIWSNALLRESVADAIRTHQQAIVEARQRYKPILDREGRANG
jgi:hypothetical protein